MPADGRYDRRAPVVGAHPIRSREGTDGRRTLGPGTAVPPDPAGKILPGSSWRFQFWYRDVNGPLGTGSNFSDALEVIFCD